MATHSGILAWRISWTEEPGRLQSMGPQRVGYDWVTKHSPICMCIGMCWGVVCVYIHLHVFMYINIPNN